MSNPLIGITANQFVQGHSLARTAINNSYIHAVLRAGGIPVIIPSGIAPDLFNNLLGSLGGILFTGGVDINPACYGAPMHPQVTEVDLERDEMEIAMLNWAVKNNKPFMGICRGIELVNVALGGTLYTHLYDQFPDVLFHTCYPDLPRNFLAHTIRTESSSKLQRVLGEKDVWVNSLHHQGVRKLGSNLRATAHSSDGLVEGIELTTDHPFGIAVQWHPEELVDIEPMLNLFRTFINASSD